MFVANALRWRYLSDAKNFVAPTLLAHQLINSEDMTQRHTDGEVHLCTDVQYIPRVLMEPLPNYWHVRIL